MSSQILPAAVATRIVFSLTTGWALRNYLHTGIIERLSRVHPVVVICPQRFRATVEAQAGTAVSVKTYDAGAEPFTWRVLRQARKKLYLESRDSVTERIWDEYGQRPAYKRVASRVIKSLIGLAGAARLGRWAEQLDLALNHRSPADALFGPDDRGALFIATHASTYADETLFRAARSAGARTVLMILSWDHLSSKIVVGRGFDHLFVWNELSKAEILATMTSYRPEQIHAVGAPQFDVYGEPAGESYAQWCARLKLDPARRTILFSTMPQVRHDGQHLILQRLVDAFRAEPTRFGDLQVLVKVHPFDNSGLYDRFETEGFVRVLGTTLEKGKRQDEWIPRDDSMLENRDALTHSALNINIFSTMTLEAAWLDTPIVHIAFDCEGQTNPIPCIKYYDFDHFKPIVDAGCSILATSFDELLAAIERSLLQPQERQPQRQRVARRYFGVAPGRSAATIEQALLQLARPAGATSR